MTHPPEVGRRATVRSAGAESRRARGEARVGIDLRVLQIGHQYRGIGEHVRQLVQGFPFCPGFGDQVFVFLIYGDLEDPTATLAADLDRYPCQEVRRVGELPSFDTHSLSGLAGRLVSDLKHSNERILRGVDLDVLLCVDFNLGVPRKPAYRTALILYDLIPWLFREDYLPTIRGNLARGSGLRRTVRDAYLAWRYNFRLRRAVANADLLLPISEHTRRDFEEHLAVPARKLRTIRLGTSHNTDCQSTEFELRGVTAGGKEVRVDLRHERYLLYFGGADPRRRIDELVSAFEIMRAGSSANLRLFLAGFDFRATGSIPQGVARDAVTASASRDDIVLFGFVSVPQRRALLREAIAFVFPSRYEGLGLPILEAMSNDCPVISYENSGIVECGGDAVLYARSPREIAEHAFSLMTDEGLKQEVVRRGSVQARRFSWSHTAEKTLEALCGLLEPD